MLRTCYLRSEHSIQHLQRTRVAVRLLISKLICSWCFCTYHTTNQSVPNQEKFFHALGTKVRELRKKHGYSQEDMISFGFSARHFQQIEAGRPITVTTMLRLCEVLEVSMEKLVKGLDTGVYEKLSPERIMPERRRRK